MSAAGRAAPRDPWVGAWLIAVCLLVIAMILIGGATRLTGSGLSITEWKLVTGAIPPLSGADWSEAFAKYRETAQFKLKNPDIALADFQILYWWEWSHRLLGRVIGFVFILPFVLFWMAGRLSGRLWSCLLLLALGGLQGFVGWWMVQSGLEGRIAVSPVRLAIHLGLAFIILALAWRLALGAYAWPQKSGRLGGRPLDWILIVALFVQIILGAFMAGSGAGLAYSDWPTIGGEWLPHGYARMSPFIDNLIANHATIQFNHRTAGYVVVALAGLTAMVSASRGVGPPQTMAFVVLGLALMQAALGIGAIVMGAPLGMNIIHQGGAILLWLAAHALSRAAAWR
ncbi:MAG TPA: COX15/CtaA family protein [Caulobacterales bacterium]|nr:COX15/CtaA family protein [Caulobacterales bacterium]